MWSYAAVAHLLQGSKCCSVSRDTRLFCRRCKLLFERLLPICRFETVWPFSSGHFYEQGIPAYRMAIHRDFFFFCSFPKFSEMGVHLFFSN